MSERSENLTAEEIAEKVRARRRQEHREDQADKVQTGVGAVCLLAGLVFSGYLLTHPEVLTDVGMGALILHGMIAVGPLVAGILVAVPGARPWIIRMIERLPWTKDLPDDWTEAE